MDFEPKKCQLQRCGEPFTPKHLNEGYCSFEHQNEAKRARQKLHRDSYKRFIPLFIKNNDRMAELIANGITNLTPEDIDRFELDISLCRTCRPPDNYPDSIMMDFGEFYLLTNKNFLTFQLFKHETADPTVQSV
jgi:hypothetical protein